MGKDLNGKELGKGIDQKKDGRYAARFTNKFGKRVEFRSRNLNEIKKWLRDSQYKDEYGLSGNGIDISVEDWFNLWINTYKKDVVAYSTYKNYVNNFNNHIKPIIGHLLLKDVKPLHCQSILNNLYDNAYSFGTMNLCRITMHSLFDGAVVNNYMINNPINSSVKCKQREVKPRTVLTIQQQNVFNQYCENNIYKNIFQLVLQTGLRCGEIGGLKWEDIDFNKKELRVRRTLLNAKAKGGFYLSSPKTKTSNRLIPLTDTAIDILNNQKYQLLKQATRENWHSEEPFQDLVFKTNTGRPVGQSHLSTAIIRIITRINNDRMIEAKITNNEFIEFPSITMHSLRHTFATRCIENGMKPKSLQTLLGHSNIGITMDLYVHMTNEELVKEVQKINWGKTGDN